MARSVAVIDGTTTTWGAQQLTLLLLDEPFAERVLPSLLGASLLLGPDPLAFTTNGRRGVLALPKDVLQLCILPSPPSTVARSGRCIHRRAMLHREILTVLCNNLGNDTDAMEGHCMGVACGSGVFNGAKWRRWAKGKVARPKLPHPHTKIATCSFSLKHAPFCNESYSNLAIQHLRCSTCATRCHPAHFQA